MSDITIYRKYGDELEKLMRFTSSPIALKMLKSEDEIPDDALRPAKDKGKHYAQCQAFALSRRDRLTVAMLKKDHRCPGPVLAYGLAPPEGPEKTGAARQYEAFEYNRYIGILSSPLRSLSFIPDLILIYCDTNQLRNMLLSLPENEKTRVKSNFFPFSCAWSVTSPIIHNEFWINLPDPGEYVRALTQAGEMIFSIPASKLKNFMAGLNTFFSESMFAGEQMMMESDFPQPEIYRDIFKKWGMYTE